MRREAQRLSRGEAEALLRAGTSGVLALAGDGGYPYAVPLSYVYADGRLCFHCAAQGHKLDAIHACDKASFCVIAQDDVLPEGFTTRYRSVIAFGRVREAVGEEKRQVMEALARRYAPGLEAEARRETEASWNRVRALVLEVEHLSGKQGRALLQQQEKGE